MDVEGIRRIDSTKIEVSQDYAKGMRVKGIIYVDENLERELEVQSIAQVANVATLPGIVKASLAMPDIHTGYGFAIGGVAAFTMKEGIISPGGVGYDIN
jgi:tRNA-splicing ligase RtcB (3'-phosphate/5'-hydroxy nucleic acid ligase)